MKEEPARVIIPLCPPMHALMRSSNHHSPLYLMKCLLDSYDKGQGQALRQALWFPKMLFVSYMSMLLSVQSLAPPNYCGCKLPGSLVSGQPLVSPQSQVFSVLISPLVSSGSMHLLTEALSSAQDVLDLYGGELCEHR